MKSTKSFLKPITVITIGLLTISILKQGISVNIKEILQTNLSNYLKSVKVIEEKSKIQDKNIVINIKIPQIYYENNDIERYINTYIRTDINEYVNHQRQSAQVNKETESKEINITYEVAFEDSKLINIVIYKDMNIGKNDYKFEKDSYVFDLKTGQRVYLDNFLKDNEDYDRVITKHINKQIKSNNMKIDKSKIEINKYTDYIISDGGILVYFNPYKDSQRKEHYEFKIPYEIFKNKIRMIQTDKIVANVDTQTITKNNKYINSIVNIPIIMTSNKDIEKGINEKIRSDIMTFYNNALEEAKIYYQNYPESGIKFVANVDFEVKKNSDNMLSINVTFYRFSGGAHGYYENISYNIDMRNGNVLQLKDLFKDNIDYKKVIDNEIRRQIDEMGKKDPESEGIYEFNGINEKQKFYLRDDNLVIYFDLYDIAPYAAGIPEFPINISVISHIVRDEYIGFFK